MNNNNTIQLNEDKKAKDEKRKIDNKKHKHNHCWEEDGKEYCVPKNFVPGVAKCGTTFLYDNLILHPQITSSVRKELNYFSG